MLSSFLLIRHELLLTLLLIITLFAEIFTANRHKYRVLNISLIGFILITLIGFLPVPSGELFGGMYQSTTDRVLIKNILNLAVVIILMQSYAWLLKPVNEGKISEFVLLIFSTLLGMNLMIASGDFLMMYIGLETATIPMAALSAYDTYKTKSAEAGIKLILSSALSTGILLYGISIIYGTTGSIYFNEVAQAFKPEVFPLLGFIFYVAGMGFKISLVPFHLWTADVYEGSPINVTSYLSVVSKGATVFIFTYMLFNVFGSITALWTNVIYTLAVVTMTVANLFAIRQNDLKRFFAFSSIAQAGFILLGILGTGALGFATVVYFILVYVFTNLAAFGVISAVYNATGRETIDSLKGFYRTNPLLSLVMMLALFSLAGIPPVAGFFGKFFLFTAAASNGFFILVFIAVLNATISLYYYLRVVKAMFIDASENPAPYFKSDRLTRISLVICTVCIFAVGFISPIFEYIKSIF